MQLYDEGKPQRAAIAKIEFERADKIEKDKKLSRQARGAAREQPHAGNMDLEHGTWNEHRAPHEHDLIA